MPCCGTRALLPADTGCIRWDRGSRTKWGGNYLQVMLNYKRRYIYWYGVAGGAQYYNPVMYL